MEKQKIFDEEFKQNVSAKLNSVKEKVSDALLTEEGKLDTQRIGNAVEDTFKKAEAGVKDCYRKFNAEYKKEDGSLDKEKLGESAKRTYRKAGRGLAAGVTKLANFLTDKFGSQGQNGEIVDAEIVTEEAPAVTAEPEDFVTE